MIAQRYQDLDCWRLANDLKLRVNKEPQNPS